MCITLVKPELQAHHPALLGHAIMPCRAMPRHASNQRRPAASGQRPAASSARHTTRSRELGPTILACPLVKIQERALQGKHKLGCHGMGLPVPLTSRSESCVPQPYRLVRWTSTSSLPTWAPTGKPRAFGQAPAQKALPADHHLSHLGRGHGDDDVNEMADATNCTPPTHPPALTDARTRTHTHTHTHARAPTPPTHRRPPATQVYFVLQLPSRRCSQTPTARHTAARRHRHRRQRQRQRLFSTWTWTWTWTWTSSSPASSPYAFLHPCLRPRCALNLRPAPSLDAL